MDNELRTVIKWTLSRQQNLQNKHKSARFLQGERLGARKGIGLEARVEKIAIQHIHIHHIQQPAQTHKLNK